MMVPRSAAAFFAQSRLDDPIEDRRRDGRYPPRLGHIDAAAPLAGGSFSVDAKENRVRLTRSPASEDRSSFANLSNCPNG
jgi:hypothetical protein